MLLKCCLLHREILLPRNAMFCIFVSMSTRWSIFVLFMGSVFSFSLQLLIQSLTQKNLFFLHDYQTFKLKVLLSFCLIFCQFYPGVGYKGVAYKKNRVCAQINSLRNISKKPIRENELLLNSKFFDWRKLLLLRYHISKWKTDMLYHK